MSPNAEYVRRYLHRLAWALNDLCDDHPLWLVNLVACVVGVAVVLIPAMTVYAIWGS